MSFKSIKTCSTETVSGLTLQYGHPASTQDCPEEVGGALVAVFMCGVKQRVWGRAMFLMSFHSISKDLS